MDLSSKPTAHMFSKYKIKYKTNKYKIKASAIIAVEITTIECVFILVNVY